MAVIDLRRGGIGESIGRILSTVGQTIGTVKDPNKKERKEFSDALRNNPALAGALSRIERDSPGFLEENFDFLDEDVMSSIRAIPPSAAERLEDIQIPALTPVGEGGTLTPEIAEMLGQFGVTGALGTTPAGAVLEPKRVEAARVIPQEAVTAGLEREVRGLTPGQQAQDEFNLEIFNTANAAFDDLELTDQKKASLRAKLSSVFFDADVAESFRQRKAIAQMQLDAANIDRAAERLEAFERSQAARWVAITNIGTPETWQLFFFNREANERARGFLDGSVTPENENDIRLFEVATAFARADQVDKIVQESAARTQIRNIIERISRVDRDGKFVNERSVRLALAEQLNAAFIELSSLTDGREAVRVAEIPKSRFDVVPFLGPGNKPLIVRDALGNEIDIGQNVQGQEPEGSVEELNFSTVDVSRLPTITRDNLRAIMAGETPEERAALFEQLREFDPASAQLIIDARRNR